MKHKWLTFAGFTESDSVVTFEMLPCGATIQLCRVFFLSFLIFFEIEKLLDGM